ncbi:ATP-binding protein [Streptomyces chartreusis]|nr:GTPase [Streptomyces chartreusis]QEV70118.1 ATP-binding protein [Streptomyces chartreusis]GGX13913.1 ATP-binding protein [Streptomyces chartreusis]
MTAVTDHDHTEHADQQEDGLTKDDERVNDTPMEGAADNLLPVRAPRAEAEQPAESEGSVAADEQDRRRLWRRPAKREGRPSDVHARVEADDSPAREDVPDSGDGRKSEADTAGRPAVPEPGGRKPDSPKADGDTPARGSVTDPGVRKEARREGGAARRREQPASRTEPTPRTASSPRTEPAPRTDPSTGAESSTPWDDGLIARRVNEAAPVEQPPVVEARASSGPQQSVTPLAYDGALRSRLDALRELVGLSRTRLDGKTLAEAGRVLDEAAARRRLSGQHTVVAIAGATGSGKSQLFNALAGVTISETGVRRPTTSSPLACSWSDGAAGLIDRLGIPPRLRRRPAQNAASDGQLRGLVLVDLPDHDSAAVQHREQVDRVLALVDAVIWVVDPEKYADAVLHERYLRPMAGHAEIMFVVLNQTDRLPGEATDQVLDDLRRLLDEDGIALGEHGEPGAVVLALSALTGDGVGDLREALGEFVTERGAAARRISADVDSAGLGLRPVYAARRRTGLSEEARDEFSARLADAIGATAAGEAAERAWLRNANRACGTPWLRLYRWYQDRSEPPTGRLSLKTQTDEEATARQRVEQAVRTVADRASAGLPTPWAQAVREAAVRGAQGLPEALDDLAARAGLPPGRPPRPGWWPAAVLVQASMTILQIVGGLWLVAQIVGVMEPNLGVPVLLMVAGIVGGPFVEWGCRMAARGPARRYGTDAERRLREAAAGCGRARVLDPVAAELLRYREVREQYGRVMGVGSTGR